MFFEGRNREEKLTDRKIKIFEAKHVLENIVGLSVRQFCRNWKLSILGNCEYILHSERNKIPVTNLPFATIEKKGTLDHFEIFLQKSTLGLMTARWVMEDTSVIWEKNAF